MHTLTELLQSVERMTKCRKSDLIIRPRWSE